MKCDPQLQVFRWGLLTARPQHAVALSKEWWWAQNWAQRRSRELTYRLAQRGLSLRNPIDCHRDNAGNQDRASRTFSLLAAFAWSLGTRFALLELERWA
jgi:hypothetical protein